MSDRPQNKEMPRYECHKTVWALKIENVQRLPGVLVFEDEGYPPIRVDPEYLRKHNPQPGGYYVVYEDGYKSFSPQEAFEEGYKPI